MYRRLKIGSIKNYIDLYVYEESEQGLDMWSKDSLVYSLGKFKMDPKMAITDKELDGNGEDEDSKGSNSKKRVGKNKVLSNWEAANDPHVKHYVEPSIPAKRMTKEFGVVIDEMSGLSQIDEIDDLRTLKQKRMGENRDVGLLDTAYWNFVSLNKVNHTWSLLNV